jgi:2-polyprenyl-3-methyl-5-hydroxy-6-metoxy-1,4-benzoquinol methylase
MRYDELWTHSPVGRLERDEVWRCMNRLFRPGDRLLDLGCGTGEDAVYLERLGVKVLGIDASPAMVRVACARGIKATVLGIEELASIQGHFDGAISNFGALNCVADLNAVRVALARLILPGGYFAVCLLGRFCLWKTLVFYEAIREGFAPIGTGSISTSLEICVHHYSIHNSGAPLFISL